MHMISDHVHKAACSRTVNTHPVNSSGPAIAFGDDVGSSTSSTSTKPRELKIIDDYFSKNPHSVNNSGSAIAFADDVVSSTSRTSSGSMKCEIIDNYFSKIQSYRVLKVLGKGTYGKVSLVQGPGRDKALFAIKEVSISSLSQLYSSKMRNFSPAFLSKVEKDAHRAALDAKIPFVNKLRQTFISNDNNVCFVSEYCSHGDWFPYLCHLQKRVPSIVRLISKYFVLPLILLHGIGVFHRDLKPSNLLVDREGRMQITDFGFAVLPCNKSNQAWMNLECGTRMFSCPELLLGLKHTPRSRDLWAVGAMMYELYFGNPPFYSLDPQELVRNITNKSISAEFQDMETKCPSLYDLLSRMLSKEPSVRLMTMRKVQQHPFFRGVDWRNWSSWRPLCRNDAMFSAMQTSPERKVVSKPVPYLLQEHPGFGVWNWSAADESEDDQ